METVRRDSVAGRKSTRYSLQKGRNVCKNKEGMGIKKSAPYPKNDRYRFPFLKAVKIVIKGAIS